MHCLVVEYPTPADPARFRSYYESRHLPLARTLRGLLRDEVHWPAPLNPAAEAPFCVFRAYFEDARAMEAALVSEIGAELAQDVPNYSPLGARMYHYAA